MLLSIYPALFNVADCAVWPVDGLKNRERILLVARQARIYTACQGKSDGRKRIPTYIPSSRWSRCAIALISLQLTGSAALGQVGKVFTGQGDTAPQVKRFIANTGASDAAFFAYPGFTGGVRVAAGDVNGDGVADFITGPNPTALPVVNVFDGKTLAMTSSFFAYAAAFTGGVYVGAGDVNNDGHADIITGPGAGAGPEVKVFSGTSGAVLQDFFAYGIGFTGGVTVAGGDVNHDGHADIITGVSSSGPAEVKVFSGLNGSVLADFFAYNPLFMGGVYVAAGDVNGDGFADIITGAGQGAGPEVKVFSGFNGSVLADFFALNPSFTGGVRVGATDVNGDGRADIIVGAGPGALPLVNIYDGATLGLYNSFNAYDATFTGGVYVTGAAVPEPIVALPALVLLCGVWRGRRRI